MKIVFCYKYCTLGGCETVLSTRMHELRSLGVDAHAVFLDGGDGEELFGSLGDRVSICRQPSAVENKLSALRPDFLISLDTPQICDYVDRRSWNARFVFEVHSTYPESLKRLKQMSRHKVSALLTPSHAQRELVLSLLGSGVQCPVEVVPNPLRPSFSMSAETPKYHRPIVIWVGRLDPHKNWRMYIEICRRLKSSGADMEYWIVGTPKTSTSSLEKARLWEEIKKADLASRFRWLPYVQYHKMGRLLRFAACSGGCLVSTSRQESFGMVAAEAMASSCPVVVPDVGGFRDFVINGETGFRYPPGEPQPAVNYILKSGQDIPGRAKIVAAGYQRVHGEYSARSAVLKLVDTLQNLRTSRTPCN
jgi:L-malate glycosyltransferase